VPLWISPAEVGAVEFRLRLQAAFARFQVIPYPQPRRTIGIAFDRNEKRHQAAPFSVHNPMSFA